MAVLVNTTPTGAVLASHGTTDQAEQAEQRLLIMVPQVFTVQAAALVERVLTAQTQLETGDLVVVVFWLIPLLR